MRLFLVAASFFIAQTLFSATVTLKDTVHNIDFDWSSEDFYTGGKAPSDDDTVVIPAGVTARLNASSDSFAAVNRLKRITPAGGGGYWK